MNMLDDSGIDWDKGDGLVPAVVQDAWSGRVLMVGWMNREALAITRESWQVTFWSRSKGRLWTKGETSGHVLAFVDLRVDCDGDTLLVLADPQGPTCHRGTETCFDPTPAPRLAFLDTLDALVESRRQAMPEGSYTTKLFTRGLPRIAQKVGEEGVETALAAVTGDDDALVGEAADLVFHLLVLLRARGLSLATVVDRLFERHAPAQASSTDG
jgi:phosphoribosyl-ATP pyrophosphohydrolase/phosphoribosyl-AMP cyclohydrolase